MNTEHFKNTRVTSILNTAHGTQSIENGVTSKHGLQSTEYTEHKGTQSTRITECNRHGKNGILEYRACGLWNKHGTLF